MEARKSKYSPDRLKISMYIRNHNTNKNKLSYNFTYRKANIKERINKEKSFYKMIDGPF